MFKFNFDVDVDEEVDAELSHPSLTSNSPAPGPSTSANLKPSTEISLDSLLSALPPLISYSPLPIPLSNGKRTLTLARRDLFDARFQLISLGETDGGQEDAEKETEGKEEALGFLDAPSDLVPGVYEGGLKTWECSLDLVDCLDGILGGDVQKLKGKRALEVGCGTAIPSMYLLHLLFSSQDTSNAGSETVIHLQDYNALVLRLVTLPNIILAWYMSPASYEFRHSRSEINPGPDSEITTYPPADSNEPGELPLTPDLLAAFTEGLSSRRIDIRFFDGSWETFALSKPYDLVLTSETIYRQESLEALVSLLSQATCGPHEDPQSLEKLAEAHLKIDDGTHEEAICLVAAKLVYFGVGGGVAEFMRAVQEYSFGGHSNDKNPRGTEGGEGKVETIWERTEGVKRCVMRVRWR